MAQPTESGRRPVPLTVVLLLVAVAVAALVWGALTLAPGHSVASHPAAVATSTSTQTPTQTSAPTPTTAPTPTRPPATDPTSSAASTPDPERSRGPLNLVVLGDSVPAAGTCDCDGYPSLVGRSLQTATDRAVTVHNDANGGWTTSDVEGDLSSAKTSADLSNANLVVVEVGANDFDLDQVDNPDCLPAATSSCWAPTLTALRTGLTAVVAGILREDTRPAVQVVLVGYWNVTLDGDVAQAEGQSFVTGSDALTRATNQVISDVAGATHSTYVDAYTPFKDDPTLSLTSALLDDGDHLSAKGHTIMAAAIMATLTRNGVVAALATAR